MLDNQKEYKDSNSRSIYALINKIEKKNKDRRQDKN